LWAGRGLLETVNRQQIKIAAMMPNASEVKFLLEISLDAAASPQGNASISPTTFGPYSSITPTVGHGFDPPAEAYSRGNRLKTSQIAVSLS
jgi:hypothetical protein